MHTDRIILQVATFAMILLAYPTIAQRKDSLSSTPINVTSPFKKYWTQPRIVPKFGVGMQDRAFVEVGLQHHSIYRHPLSLASRGGYITTDIFIDRKNLLLGPKVGYEFTAGFLGIAADVTYFIDHNYDENGDTRRAWAFTPKIGISILGFANLFYGYQIPLSDTRITSIYRNRFSLVFNLNRDYFDLNDAPRKYRR